MPKVRKTICKRTLPYIMFIGRGSKPQLQAQSVQICTQSTDSYREAEYPYIALLHPQLAEDIYSFLEL
jgi:hypothetical protein